MLIHQTVYVYMVPSQFAPAVDDRSSDRRRRLPVCRVETTLIDLVQENATPRELHSATSFAKSRRIVQEALDWAAKEGCRLLLIAD